MHSSKIDLATAIQDLNRTFAKSSEVIGQSLINIGAAMCRSIEVMSQSLQSAANSNIQNQNSFYQQGRQQFILRAFTQMLNQLFQSYD